MREQAKQELQAALNTFDQRNSDAEKHARQLQKEQSGFLGEFRKLVETVINPAMEEVGAMLVTCGHRFGINKAPGANQLGGESAIKTILLKIAPANVSGSIHAMGNDCPEIGFRANEVTKQVRVEHALGSGRSDPGEDASTHAIKQLTPEKVMDELIHRVGLILHDQFQRQALDTFEENAGLSCHILEGTNGGTYHE
jgi:hypothetical protein